MVRLVIIGIVIAVAFTLYALVDAAMSDASRARGVPKPVWVVLVVVLPVIGGVLWFTIGKGSGASAPRPTPPDDDPRFSGTRLSEEDLDAHMRDLEERLRELDDEVFPGEPVPGSAAAGDERTGRPSGAGSNAPVDGARTKDGADAAPDGSDSDAAGQEGADPDAGPGSAGPGSADPNGAGPSSADRP